MSTQYIKTGARYEALDAAGAEALQALPDDKRPVLYTAADPAVRAWLVADARARGAAATVVLANTIRERIARSQHYLQAARWPIQLAAAQAVVKGNGSAFDQEVLGREARLRGKGETLEQLAHKVIANSLVFASVGAAVDGVERATLDAIAAYGGNDPADIDAILAVAKQTAGAEFLDIFTPLYGVEGARAAAAQFFGG